MLISQCLLFSVHFVNGDRWLNMSTEVYYDYTQYHEGDYICEACTNRGTPSQVCHNATVSVHMIGSVPVINKGKFGEKTSLIA